jgi:HlyD family secretion protein
MTPEKLKRAIVAAQWRPDRPLAFLPMPESVFGAGMQRPRPRSFRAAAVLRHPVRPLRHFRRGLLSNHSARPENDMKRRYGFPPLTVALAGTALLAACPRGIDAYFPGYVEAEYVRLAAPIAGTLQKLYVRRGDAVTRDAPAFVLEQDSERAAREEAAARVRQARAQVADLKKGRRPDEVAALREQLLQAQAQLRLSTATYARQRQLVGDHFISPATLDEAQAALQRDTARVKESQAQLRIARAGARSDEILAAEQELEAAEAQLAQAEWRLTQKTQRIPVDGEVADVMYREGEWVPAGSPIVSLLPPRNVKLRFFVPETAVAALRPGQEVTVHCDGCARSVAARIGYRSSSPEYTSPLIYSRENRATLVFLIEAWPAAGDAALLYPGQPVEIRLAKR